MDQNDAYWGYGQSHAEQARQHENLRAQAGSIVAAVSAAIVAFIAESGVDRSDLGPAIVLAALGLLGLLLTSLHSRKADNHNAVVKKCREKVEQSLNISLGQLTEGKIDRGPQHNFPLPKAFLQGQQFPVPKGAIRQAWSLINVLIIGGGLALAVLAYNAG